MACCADFQRPASLEPVNQPSEIRTLCLSLPFLSAILISRKPRPGRKLQTEGKMCNSHHRNRPDEHAAPSRVTPPTNTPDPADCKVSCRLRRRCERHSKDPRSPSPAGHRSRGGSQKTLSFSLSPPSTHPPRGNALPPAEVTEREARSRETAPDCTVWGEGGGINGRIPQFLPAR